MSIATKAQPRQAAEVEARRLVDTYADLVLRLAYTLLGSRADAEDVCQTVLLRVMTKAPRFEDSEHERAWIIRTARNACLDLIKSSARKTTVSLDAESAQGLAVAPPEPDLAVTDAVARLPEDQREAIYLHYFEGYPIREIAVICNCSEAAVAKRLSRARSTLRHTLGEDHG